jgi:hypothetical protein
VAAAGPYRVKNLEVISGASPFAAGCPGALFDETHIAGAEIEPSITVNPANPQNIVATWQQDLGFAARSDLIGASHDGGKTWQRVTMPGLTRCTGGTYDAASDPWVSVGVDGTVYFTALPGLLSSDPPAVALLAAASGDGGRSWSPLATVAPADPRVDKEVVTADPIRPGHAYVVWADRDPFAFPLSNSFRFAQATDGGMSWSAPVAIDLAPPNGLDQSGEVLVLPEGTLLAIFSRIEFDLSDFTVTGTLLAARSSDQGLTWTSPVAVASEPLEEFADPETGQELSNQDLVIHSAAVAPDGTVYIAWDHDSSPTSGAIEIARSKDGGLTWSGPGSLPGVTAFAFDPAIAVEKHGTVGLIWYDHRNDRPGDGPLTTDVWFAHSDDGGNSWRQTHVAGPFDLRTVPSPTGFWRLGEYQGLAALGGRGFAAVFTQAAPQAKNGPTDIFFARIGPGRRERLNFPSRPETVAAWPQHWERKAWLAIISVGCSTSRDRRWPLTPFSCCPAPSARPRSTTT